MQLVSSLSPFQLVTSVCLLQPPGHEPAGRGQAQVFAQEGLPAAEGGAVFPAAARSTAALREDVSELRDPAVPALRDPALTARLHRPQPTRPLRHSSRALLTALPGDGRFGAGPAPKRLPAPKLDPSGWRILARQQLCTASATAAAPSSVCTQQMHSFNQHKPGKQSCNLNIS